MMQLLYIKYTDILRIVKIMELSYNSLLSVLNVANGSERSEDQQHAEAQLKKWEIYPGYYFLLQEIYLKIDLPLQVRWLAIICFKNGIDKHWRSSRPNSIRREEKEQIKSRLFQLLHEKNNQLTIQNAHSIARIVRFDFPSDWPTLFDDIAKNLESLVLSNDLISTNNLLLILNQIIKNVSMVRIGRARHTMQAKAPVLTPLLIKIYLKFFQEWTQRLDLSLMEVCYLCLKNIRRIIPEGYEQPHKSQDVTEFLKLSVEHLQGLILEHEKYSSDLLERYVKCYCKLYVNIINNNPTSFILLPCSKDIIATFLSLLESKAEIIFNSSEENDFWEILALKGFLILKKIINYIYKKGAITLKQRNNKEEVNAAIKKLSQEYFTPEVIQHLCDLIINWYLRLKPSDLEGWLLEPEEWCNEELSTSWEYQIRPCAENFFQDLILIFNDYLTDFIINKISNELMKQATVEDILTRDSILCTLQLSSNTIANNVNFDSLLKDVLIPDSSKNDIVEKKILKRRVCLIITEWVSVQCSRESRISIYKLLIAFLQPGNNLNDKVVKLTSIQTLKSMVDDWDFNKYDFKEYLDEFISLSLNFLTEVDYTESKLYILNILSSLLERCNPLVTYRTLISIFTLIPQYWNSGSAENETILKNSLLRLLKNLAISLNENSPEVYSIAFPLIRECCGENSQYFSLFSEEGYDLWLSVCQYCPVEYSNNEELLNLFVLIPHSLMNSTEILPTILSIIRSYALISLQLFENNEEIFRILSGYLPNMRDDAFTIFISFMDILLLQNSGNTTFVNSLMNSGIFSAMINYVMDDKQTLSSVNKILLVLSRLAYKENELFVNIFDHLSLDIARFVEKWMETYNSNGNPRSKKISLLAMLSLTTYGVVRRYDLLLLKFSVVIKNALLFLEEIQETDNGSCIAYNQNLVYEDIDDYCYLDSDIKPHGEKIRYQKLLESDPVYLVNLKSYISDIIKQLKGGLEASDFEQLMSLNDQYTSESLQSLVF